MCGAKVTRCPVTSSTLISILQSRVDPLTEMQGGRVVSSLPAPDRKRKAWYLLCYQTAEA